MKLLFNFLPLLLWLLVVFQPCGARRGGKLGAKWRIDSDFAQRSVGVRTEFDQVRKLMRQFLWKTATKKDGRTLTDFNLKSLVDKMPERQDDGTEVFNNYGNEADLFESDIVLTLPQMRSIVGDSLDGSARQKRKVIAGERYRWKSTTIPYQISADSKTRAAVTAALQYWQQNTCLRFRESSANSDRIRFIKGQGCYSNIGRIGGAQDVSIGGGCTKLGIVLHEIGHALGFWHEQSRSDRDSYIEVKTGNILNGFQGNFQKRSTSDVISKGGAYDLGSVMHYGSKGFTIRRDLRTIETRDSNYRNTIGQREKLSFIDVKQINNLYCTATCSRPLSCRHGGYADPNNCRVCKCPDGLSGNCDRVQSSKSRCGGELTATNQWQSLSSPTVTRNQECYWRISNPERRRILIDVSKIDVNCRETCSSYLEVKYNNLQQTGPRFCCSKPTRVLRSKDAEILLIFRTDNTVSSRSGGFQARYKSDGDGPTPVTRTTTQRPRTTTTRRPRLTTPRRPRPTRRPTTGGSTTNWSSWSRCTHNCGGCGKQTRTRIHVVRRSRHRDVQRRSCGTQVCRRRRPDRNGRQQSYCCSGYRVVSNVCLRSGWSRFPFGKLHS